MNLDAERCPTDEVPTIALAVLASRAQPLQIGDRVGGYRLERHMHEGPMGRVFEARQLSMNRRVAVKVLPRAEALDRVTIGRFYREVRAVASLSHPNIVVPIDFGIDERSGEPFLVTEYISGQPLDIVIDRGPIDTSRATRLMLQLANALTEAHDKGVVHCDLKPGNLIISKLADGSEQLKVLDFGISQFVRSDSASHQTPDDVAGTPHFMSPEQALSEPVDHRSDLYSLGCLLFTMITGRFPFHASEPLETLVMHVNEPPPPFPAALGVRPGLEELYFRLLSKDRADRPVSARAVAVALHEQLPREQLPREQAPVSPARPALVTERMERSTPVAPAVEEPGPLVTSPWIIPALLILFAGVAFYFATQGGAGPSIELDPPTPQPEAVQPAPESAHAPHPPVTPAAAEETSTERSAPAPRPIAADEPAPGGEDQPAPMPPKTSLTASVEAPLGRQEAAIAVEAPAAAPPTRSAMVLVDTTPTDSVLYENNRRLGNAPLKVARPDSGVRVLRVRHGGFHTQTLKLGLDTPDQVMVILPKKARTPAKAPAQSKPPQPTAEKPPQPAAEKPSQPAAEKPPQPTDRKKSTVPVW